MIYFFAVRTSGDMHLMRWNGQSEQAPQIEHDARERSNLDPRQVGNAQPLGTAMAVDIRNPLLLRT